MSGDDVKSGGLTVEPCCGHSLRWHIHSGCDYEVTAWRCTCRLTFEQALAAREARGRAEALREAAHKWQIGEWINAPHRADPVAQRIANGQFVGDWLRQRADRIEAAR